MNAVKLVALPFAAPYMAASYVAWNMHRKKVDRRAESEPACACWRCRRYARCKAGQCKRKTCRAHAHKYK
ncbi:hypothetical protein pqer_cds_714 [Pandoravirus quercus]|uniref:Uncharacterized protein n=1 Tax=Pandoravirus quercus TaxID=2107709 RepID=A0A2U7U9N3_9VIRU|nr:hypothetical protein pqer_cds_714 [Pandoravirus quercus]AVK75136.1 hypothetical protein pqer_cds_714 [Pandoravirus quercus]